MDLVHIICALSGICFICIDGLSFHLAPHTRRCLKEEIHKDVLVTGEYELSDGPGHKTSLRVKGNFRFFTIANTRPKPSI